MEWDRGRSGGRELIDFASSPPSRGLEFNARLSVGAVTLTHCTSGPIEGRQLGAAQITAAIHDGATFDMDWRGGESDRLRCLQQNSLANGTGKFFDGTGNYFCRTGNSRARIGNWDPKWGAHTAENCASSRVPENEERRSGEQKEYHGQFAECSYAAPSP
jgi:hypothetical protein